MAEMYGSRFGMLDSSKFKSVVTLGGVHGCWMFLEEDDDDDDDAGVASLLLVVSLPVDL
jgi:hypothetical protein